MTDSFQEPNLQALLEKIARHENFKNARFSIKNSTKPGENFAGSIITVEISEDKNGKVLSLIFKTSSPSKAHQQMINSGLLFRNESLMYESVFPGLNKFLKEFGIADNISFPGTPRCFGLEVHDEEDGVSDVIVLENKKIENFVILDVKNGLDFVECKLVLKWLALLHGTSMAMNVLKPEAAHVLRETLSRRLWNNPPTSLLDDMKKGMTNGLGMLGEPYKNGNIVYEKLFKICENFHVEFPKHYAAPEDLSCLAHSDVWTNNILFRLSKDGVAEDVCLLDFQTSGYSSPVVDLSPLLLFCTTKEVRDAHFNCLQRFYFEEVSRILRSYGCDAAEMFSWSLYESHWRRYGSLGVVLSILGLPLLLSYDPNVNSDVHAAEGKSSMFDHTANLKDAEITKRITDIVSDAVHFGFL